MAVYDIIRITLMSQAVQAFSRPIMSSRNCPAE